MNITGSCFETPFGTGLVCAVLEGITSVTIPDLSRHTNLHFSNIPAASSSLTISAADLLTRYFNGEQVDFQHLPVSLQSMTDFRKTVLEYIRSISFGSIRSYGQVAVACGAPLAARAIGGALAANPVPIIIPCHRVVAQNGSLTGFSAPGGVASKQLLLEMEGILFYDEKVCQKQLVMNRN